MAVVTFIDNRGVIPMIEQLQQEINELHARVKILQQHIEELQQTCDHHFCGDSYFVKCTKCHKIEVLYY